MIIIADSGSTKCDWIVINERGDVVNTPATMGFNPYFHSEAVIATAVKQNEDLSKYAEEVTHIYYYGAGCSSKELNGVVRRALKLIFEEAEIVVDHDLLGAAYATYDGSPGISCILGTGSNSCYFDGCNIREEVPALGYILGDEGSGSYFGKKLLSGYLYKQLPEQVLVDFKERYEVNMKEIVDNVYTKPNANVYLASFVRFISNYKSEPYFQEMLHNGMKEFLKTHVMCFPEHKEVKTHFVGSVAFYFNDAIESAAHELGIKVGNIVRKPIDNMVKFHLNKLIPETVLKKV